MSRSVRLRGQAPCPVRRFAVRRLASAVFVAALPQVALAEEPKRLDEITVTSTREGQPLAETPAAVTVIGEPTIAERRPAHPAQLMNLVPGVLVNVTNGEGHMAAIRQPISTSPSYLYLEDGIPTRSTGFFNHNALYEINLPQAGGLEVLRGPGSALYGSDALGAVVNVITRPAPLKPEVSLEGEAGMWGWARALLSGGGTWGADGLRADLNLTRTDGWRDATSYDRESATVRWDRTVGSDATLKTVVTGTNVNQQTAGTAQISRADYTSAPRTNYTPISYREVRAFRASTAWEREGDSWLLSVTPYLRANDMEMMPNWSLSYDPSISDSGHLSAGMLLKYRRDFASWRTRVIVGADLDYSPGWRKEWRISTTKVGSIYTAYAMGAPIYDYDVTFWGASPFLHIETSPVEKLRLTAGLRADLMGYDYQNNMSTVITGSTRRPASTEVNFGHLSPKLGAAYQLHPAVAVFADYRHGFRVPSESQMFRAGSSAGTVDLEPIKIDSYEAGLRGRVDGVRYEAAAYWMIKRDDILTYNASGTSSSVNSGKTLHRGVEGGLGVDLPWDFSADAVGTYAVHSFEAWQPNTTTDLSGKEQSAAPRFIGSARLAWRPQWLSGGRLELEWLRVGEFWMDDANTHAYEGHHLFNLRGDYAVNDRVMLFGRVMNLFDKRFAESAGYTTSRGEELAPGLPFTVYAGARVRF